MVRTKIVCGLFLTTLLAATTSNADWHDFWGRVELDRNRNNAWPEPFRYMDRQSVRGMLAMQTSRAWQLETTLGAHHFDPESNALTTAGEAKLYWILVHAPSAHRTVFVTTSRDVDTTEMRVDSVQQMVARMLPQGALPSVVRTITPAPTARGDLLDQTWQQHKSAIPSPVLPADAPTGSGE